MKKFIAITIALLAVVTLLAACGTDSNTTSAPSASNDSEVVEVETTLEPELTTSQKNAIRMAESYLDFTSFSRSGLIEQLEYEGFSNEDAVFAVDNIEVDWNEQAVKEAASYLDFMAFSFDGIVEQLEYEGFTHEQAVYGAQQNGF